MPSERGFPHRRLFGSDGLFRAEGLQHLSAGRIGRCFAPGSPAGFFGPTRATLVSATSFRSALPLPAWRAGSASVAGCAVVDDEGVGQGIALVDGAGDTLRLGPPALLEGGEADFALDVGVDLGPVDAVGPRQGAGVDRGAAGDERLVVSRRGGDLEGFLERGGLADSRRQRRRRAGEDDRPAAGQGAAAGNAAGGYSAAAESRERQAACQRPSCWTNTYRSWPAS